MRRRAEAGAGRLEFIPPMEPKLVAMPPEGDNWIHEIKLDGYRAQIIINGPEDIRVYTEAMFKKGMMPVAITAGSIAQPRAKRPMDQKLRGNLPPPETFDWRNAGRHSRLRCEQ